MKGQVGAAGLDDAPVQHHVHHVGLDVVQIQAVSVEIDPGRGFLELVDVGGVLGGRGGGGEGQKGQKDQGTGG